MSDKQPQPKMALRPSARGYEVVERSTGLVWRTLPTKQEAERTARAMEPVEKKSR